MVSSLPRVVVRLLGVMVFLVVVVWTNLSGLGIGEVQLTYDSTALPRLAIAAIGTTGAWLLMALMLRRGNAIAWDLTWVLLAALAVWAVVSALLADTSVVWLGQSERLEGVVTVALYAALFGAGLQIGRSARSARTLAAALVLGALAVSVHGILQFARVDPTDYAVSGTELYVGSAFASLGNPNFLAGLLVLALPVAVALAVTSATTLRRVLAWICAMICLFALYATYSQAAWLAVLVEGAIAVGLWLHRRRRATRDAAHRSGWHSSALVAVAALSIVGVGVAVIMTVSAVADDRGLRLWGESIPESVAGRLYLAQATADIVAGDPITGIGPDNYLEGFRLHRPEGYVEVYGPRSTNNNAHNWVLQYAATLGVPGALLLSLALVAGILRSRPVVGGEGTRAETVLRTAIWLGVVGHAVQMMFNVATPASAVPFWLLMGVICAPRARRVIVRGFSTTCAVGASAALLVLAVVGSGLAIAADATFMASRTAFHANDGTRALNLAERAFRLNPLSVKYSRGVADVQTAMLLSLLREGDTTEQQVRARYAEARESYAVTLGRSERDYAAWAWMSALQAATGSYLGDAGLMGEAQESARTAAALDRQHDEVAALVGGEVSALSIFSARSAPPLP